MELFDRHPAARWAAPAAAVAVVAALSLATSQGAQADAPLPPRTAAQLLTDLQQPSASAMSGTVRQRADLGLPEISLGGGGGRHGSSSSDLSSILSGTHTWRVWYDGPERARLALVGSRGESAIVRNGDDLWLWASEDETAEHYTLAHPAAGTRTPSPGAADLPKTPEEAAERALAAIEPSTLVTTTGTAVVAGRSAYELELKPRDNDSLVARVSIAVDAERQVPLRVQVFSTKIANPAIDVGFTSVDFARPAARHFAFSPPPGATVTEGGVLEPPAKADGEDQPLGERPSVVGTGWGAVLVGRLPEPGDLAGANGDGPGALEQAQAVLELLPAVSGSWGSGRLVTGTLFSAVLADDGRFAVGAVAPERLYAALAAR